MKHILMLVLLLAFVTLMPANAQAQSVLDWIPADFDGFIRVDMSDTDQTLDFLNAGVRASQLIARYPMTTSSRWLRWIWKVSRLIPLFCPGWETN
jgi:hypothetical protein